MKFLPLIWTNLWRKPVRTSLTVLSIFVAFFLFGVLQGIDLIFSGAVGRASVNRLIVTSRVSMTDLLPQVTVARIRGVPGVAAATGAIYFGGYFQDPKQSVFSYAIDPGEYFALYPEFTLPPYALDDFVATRSGAVIGAEMARTRGWKTGDHITLMSTIWTRFGGKTDWDFDIVGIYDNPSSGAQTNTFFLNQSYLDEGRTFAKGMMSQVVVGVRDTGGLSAVSKAIDSTFANSANETRTQSEKEYAQAFLRQIGNVSFIARSVIGATFFALLLVAGSTMLQSVRERTGELAVLKAIGYSDTTVLNVVLLEALTICLVAAAIGLLAAAAAFPLVTTYVGKITLISSRAIPWRALLFGTVAAVGLALITGLPPSLRARRIVIAKALAAQ